MAMHQPCTWVVGQETNDKPTTSREHCNVLAGWIGVLQFRWIAEYTSPRTKKIEIMTVKMDGMRYKSNSAWDFLDDPELPLQMVS